MTAIKHAGPGAHLKRRTFALEPADLADPVREREAVLRRVGDGVLAVDAEGRVCIGPLRSRRIRAHGG